jgi:uncharacterized protein YdhG (YjbR/CyaY superfamily)
VIFGKYCLESKTGEISLNGSIAEYLARFNEPTKRRFFELYNLLLESTETEIEEKMWARLPSFYREGKFIRLIPFEGHINIEAKAILTYKDKLQNYKITTKGMLQIKHEQEIPKEILRLIFRESLER